MVAVLYLDTTPVCWENARDLLLRAFDQIPSLYEASTTKTRALSEPLSRHVALYETNNRLVSVFASRVVEGEPHL